LFGPRRAGAAGVVFVVVVLLATPAAALAADLSAQPLLLAEGEISLRRFLASMSTRTGVVRLSAVVLAVALFVMLKKFSPDPDRRDRTA
jgi:hypothetical protein